MGQYGPVGLWASFISHLGLVMWGLLGVIIILGIITCPVDRGRNVDRSGGLGKERRDRKKAAGAEIEGTHNEEAREPTRSLYI